MNKIYRRNRIDLPIGVKIIAYLILFLSGPILIMALGSLPIYSFGFLLALILFIIFPLSSILILAKKILGLDILSFGFIALFFVLIIYSIVNNIKPILISVLISTIPFLTGIYLLSRRKIILTIIKYNKEIAKQPPLPIDYRILVRIIAYSTIYFSEYILIMIFATIINEGAINSINNLLKDPNKNIILMNIAILFSLFILSILMIMRVKRANYLLASLYIILAAYLSYIRIIHKEELYNINFYTALPIILLLLLFSIYIIFRKNPVDLIREKLI